MTARGGVSAAAARLRENRVRIHLRHDAAVGKDPLRCLKLRQCEHLHRNRNVARGIVRWIALRKPPAQRLTQGGLFLGNAHRALRTIEKISSCFSSSARSAPSFMNGTTVHP